MDLARRLRTPITVQQKTRIEDEGGGDVGTWSDWRRGIWAEVRPLTGTEQLTAGQVEPRTIYIVTIRHLSGLQQDMQIILKSGAALEIQSIRNIEMHSEAMELLCRERPS